MFSGLDIHSWDDHLQWLWQWSNLRFVGFYLAHSAGQTVTTWTNRWHALKDLGWGVVPFWLPFKSNNINAMVTANGTSHGQTAVNLARAAQLENGAAIYLDIESPVFASNGNGFVNYVRNWMQAVHDGGYAPGAYCSRLDANRILTGGEFRPLRPVIWPFSVARATRAGWDNEHFQLAPTVANDWLVADLPRDDGAWPSNPDTIGCQFDWFNKDRDRKLFTWPAADGNLATGSGASRDVDWDMAKVFDPSHPRAAGICTAASDRANADWVRVFGVHVDVLDYLERDAVGRFSPGQNLRLGPGDIGPTPPPELNGFDPVSASATSRRHLCSDLFLLGQDGYIRTIWANEHETFPDHSWPLNPDSPARKGSPIVAVSRVLDQIDVFYVNRKHELATQWWNPGAPDWARNQRILAGPSVGGSSDLVALPSPNDALPSTERLDVLYIAFDFSVPFANPNWRDAWQVVHGIWSTRADWQFTPIPGLTRVACSSGIACVRDSDGALHLVVQNRNRLGLHHAVMQANSTTWDLHQGAGPLPADRNRPSWWMSLHLVAFESAQVLLIGMTCAGSLAWSTYSGGQWSDVGTGSVPFVTNRPLAIAKRGHSAIDIVGITDVGEIAVRSMNIGQTGGAQLMPAFMWHAVQQQHLL
jgi:hypothetical protein